MLCILNESDRLAWGLQPQSSFAKIYTQDNSVIMLD